MRTIYAKFLLGLFLLSSIVECLVAVGIFASPDMAASQFHLTLGSDTLFLLSFIGCLLVLISSLCWLTTWQLYRNNPNGWLMAWIFGTFWLCLGFALTYYTNMERFLMMDSLRGALVLALLFLNSKNRQEAAIANSSYR